MRRFRLSSLLVFVLVQGIITMLFAPFDLTNVFLEVFQRLPGREFVGKLYPLEGQGYDVWLNFTSTQPEIDDRLRFVGIDDVSQQVYGQFPWTRALHARLIEKLNEWNVKAAAFDILFADKSAVDPPGDDRLEGALRRFGHAVLACKFSKQAVKLDIEPSVFPLPKLRRASQIGFVSVDDREEEIYGKTNLRRVQLVREVDDKLINDYALDPFLVNGENGAKAVMSLDLALLARSMSLGPADVHFTDRDITVGGITIPTNAYHQMYINYYHRGHHQAMEEDLFSSIPYPRALGDLGRLPPEFSGSRVEPPKSFMKNTLVLVGATDPALGDVVDTPLGRVPGLYVHGHVLNTLLSRNWIRETPIWLYFFMLTGLPVLMVYPLMRINAPLVLAVTALVLGALTGGSYFAFTLGWWVRWVGPVISVCACSGLVVLYQFLRGHMLLRQFITPELAHDLLLAGGTGAHTTEADCTVIFSDIRGFTTLNESMAPSRMVALLKEYHTLTVPIYEKHGGRCLDYLGDAQMVVYGDPITLKRAREKNHAVAAMQAALQVHEAIEAMNERWKQRGDPPFEVGIGCCSGVTAVGVLGADTSHLQYTAIGDVTNTAARVQGLSRDLNAPVIAAETTAQKAGDRVVTERIKSVPLKGKAKEVTVYRVLGLANDPTTVERMRVCTRESEAKAPEPSVKSVLLALALLCLFSAGCISTPRSAPTTDSGLRPSQGERSTATTAPTEMPSAGILPVGSPSVILTVTPTRKDGAMPTPTGFAPAPSSSAAVSDTTLPIYPLATRKSRLSQREGQAEHVVLVLLTHDSVDTVKSWYHTRVKASAVVDSGESGSRTITLSRRAAGASDPKLDLLDTVVIQPQDDGTVQITLSSWYSLR